MRRWARWLAPAFLGAAALVLTIASGTAIAKRDGRPVDRVVMFASDGMRPDLMEKYAKAGFMPTYKKLMKDGVTGKNGMVQAFPPNTGVGWYTMATGTYPSEHGSTNNTFFRGGDGFANRTSFSGAGVLQADTIANAAERAGKKVAQIDWVGGIPANINGPSVDFASFFSNRGVLVGVSDPVEVAGAGTFGVTYAVGAIAPASGWTGVPAGDPAAPAKETTWSIPSSFAAQNPHRTYNVYFYDSNVNGVAAYDHAIVSPVGKTGASPSVDLSNGGSFKPIKLMGADGLIGARANQTVGHYVKLISLSPDLSNYKLHATSLARAAATCRTAACNALPAGGTGEDRLEKYIADNLLPWAAADFAPLESGVVPEETYIEHGRDLERAYSLQVINFILGTLQPDTDLAMVGYPFTDEVSHQFMALVSPTDIDGKPNPCYDYNPKFDDVTCTGRGTAHRVAIREGFIRSGYADADEKLGITRALMGGNPTTFAGSDHGFAPQWYAVNAIKILNGASVNGISLHASSATSTSNCSGAPVVLTPAPENAWVSGDLAKACWAGGTIQIYVSPTLPAGTTNAMVRTAARNAFLGLNTGGVRPTSQVLDKEQLRNVDGSDSLHPNRSGDLAVILRPPYQSDAGTSGQAIALSHFFGQHGYEPNLVNLANNVNMHATFVLGGPGVETRGDMKGLRAIDIAPTLSFLMGIPGPQNARGRILYDAVQGTADLREVTILDISDYHGQLIPLTEASDTLGPTFGIGGSAFLKKWFEIYEAEAALSGKNAAKRVIEMAAGDSVGATPPISNSFGDRPTMEIMNMMGMDIDGLGNHNFDRGADYLRNTLIPIAKFPFVSSNVVDAAGNTPKQWSKSHVFDLGNGAKVGFVGFTNDDAHTLTKPGAFDPFVTPIPNPIPAVNAEAARIAGKTDAIVAMGHYGATGGTLTSPTGPLANLADGVSNVDAVIGDHTDFQVLATRSNGVLVTENRSKGLRFTRVRLVIGPGEGVVYKTADFHKPFDIGLTPDGPIQARIDELNAALLPILGTQVGDSNVAVPRSDSCAAATGRTDGRACESLVGDIVTDAMRQQYGTDFAITNSGGLRDNLTCPTTDSTTDFCPSSLYPFATGHFPITRGQVLAVLPFGNQSATANVDGVRLKEFLETAVAPPPNATVGRFGQFSGLCVRYNIEAPAKQFDAGGVGLLGTGNRVMTVVRQATSGACDFATGTPVSLTAADHYTLTINDFMLAGGDGYPDSRGPGAATQDLLDQDVADYIATLPGSQVTPTIQGRVKCFDPNPAAAPNCIAGSS
jgi:2',3'-cyclic-nucleotide 2'-phosphodiesterase (5'-nucleotidase family)